MVRSFSCSWARRSGEVGEGMGMWMSCPARVLLSPMMELEGERSISIDPRPVMSQSRLISGKFSAIFAKVSLLNVVFSVKTLRNVPSLTPIFCENFVVLNF